MGQRCGRASIPGGTVCRWHGGGAPQVKRRADERLASLVDPAISVLGRALRREKLDAVSIAAARDVLDHVGPPRGKQHQV